MKNDKVDSAALAIDQDVRQDILNCLGQILGCAEVLVESNDLSQNSDLKKDVDAIVTAAQYAIDRFNAVRRLGESDSGFKIGSDSVNATPACIELPIVAKLNEGKEDEQILVVDDNENNRDLLSRHLQRNGYRVRVAVNGIDALVELEKPGVDMVLLDVMMPGLDGREVLERMKADPILRHIPVIMISANTELENVVKCIEMGAEDYLPKPFNPTLLKARISAVLEKQRLRQQEISYMSQVVQAEAALERQRSLTQAVAGVAHEINTPLGIIKTGMSIILNRLALPKIEGLLKSEPEAESALGDILESCRLTMKNVDAANRLVENFKKIAVNELTENVELVDLPVLLEDAVELFKVSARQAGIDVQINTDEIVGGRLWRGCPSHMTQIIINFLQNAERYAYPNGSGGLVRIDVTDRMPKDAPEIFVIDVRDFGAGIEKENLSKIFEPFFTTGRAKGGTGLGLAIVGNLVAVGLQGTLTVISERGHGTCFTLAFPKHPEH